MADPIRIRPLSEVAGHRVDNGTGGGDDGGMDARITKLEALAEKAGDRLTAIEKDVAILKVQSATKEDIKTLEVKVVETNNRTIMWVVGSIFLVQLLPALLKKFGM